MAGAGQRDCVMCQLAPARRRGLCWACYEKFRGQNLPLPPDLRTLPPEAHPLRRWIARLDNATLVLLRTCIEEALR